MKLLVVVIIFSSSFSVFAQSSDGSPNVVDYQSACAKLLSTLKPFPNAPLDLEITVSPRNPDGLLAISYLSESNDRWLIRQDLLAGPIQKAWMPSTDTIWAATAIQSVIWRRESDRFVVKTALNFQREAALKTAISPNLKFIARLTSFWWNGDPNLTGVSAEIIPAEGGVHLNRAYFEGPIDLTEIEDIEVNDDGASTLIMRDGQKLLPKKN